jgi:2-polyprenyl-3-methyl-5-hydroxy-6-metoxy-1,4-benzoquinol methylase
MINLTNRATDTEIMDDFTLPAGTVVPVLKGLEKMNAFFGGQKTIISALRGLPLQNGAHISDWGCGGGDILRAIAKWASDRQMQVKLTGIDATPSAIEYAREQAKAFDNIDFILADVTKHQFAENQFDVVYSNLFTHHFKDDDWVSLVKKMLAGSKNAVIITDLHRHWLLYYAVVAITSFTNSKMARFDGPLSVKRSFKKSELVSLLNKAGITNYKITWQWAFKWRVIIYKTAQQ